MSASRELQTAIFELLVADAGVHALVADRIYDNVPDDAVPPYVSFGPSDYTVEDIECMTMRTEALQVDIWTRDHSKLRSCREITDAVRKAIHRKEPALGVHGLSTLMAPRGRVFRDADGITGHGVVTVEAEIEEN